MGGMLRYCSRNIISLCDREFRLGTECRLLSPLRSRVLLPLCYNGPSFSFYASSSAASGSRGVSDTLSTAPTPASAQQPCSLVSRGSSASSNSDRGNDICCASVQQRGVSSTTPTSATGSPISSLASAEADNEAGRHECMSQSDGDRQLTQAVGSKDSEQEMEPASASLPPVLGFKGDRVPGQLLYPAAKEDIEVLAMSKRKYPQPVDVEGGVIIRLVRLSDPVTSPVGRVVRNSVYGIRGNERWAFLIYGISATTVTLVLSYWQLQRMKWKGQLIELRRSRLAMPAVKVESSPFPWAGNIDNWAYRTVEVRGVLDCSQELRVGPRPGLTVGNPGYLIVSPLRLADGSTVMVNRGHCPMAHLERQERGDIPEWVTIRAVVEPGEIVNTMVFFNFIKRLRNHPADRKFTFIEPRDLGSVSGARNLDECKEAILNAYDVLYDDEERAIGRRKKSSLEMRQKGDYLVFWADEHVHFNYAIQWLLLAGVFACLTGFRFREMTKWKF